MKIYLCTRKNATWYSFWPASNDVDLTDDGGQNYTVPEGMEVVGSEKTYRHVQYTGDKLKFGVAMFRRLDGSTVPILYCDDASLAVELKEGE